jgi:hypothetical protein
VRLPPAQLIFPTATRLSCGQPCGALAAITTALGPVSRTSRRVAV